MYVHAYVYIYVHIHIFTGDQHRAFIQGARGRECARINPQIRNFNQGHNVCECRPVTAD